MSKRNLDEDMEAEVEGLEDSEEEKEMGKTDFVFLTFFFSFPLHHILATEQTNFYLMMLFFYSA